MLLITILRKVSFPRQQEDIMKNMYTFRRPTVDLNDRQRLPYKASTFMSFKRYHTCIITGRL